MHSVHKNWFKESLANTKLVQRLKNITFIISDIDGSLTDGLVHYNKDGEAEWTMGFAWLAIIHKIFGDEEKHKHYLAKTKGVMTASGELPELYYAGSSEHNENTPLAWAQSLHIVAEQP